MIKRKFISTISFISSHNVHNDLKQTGVESENKDREKSISFVIFYRKFFYIVDEKMGDESNLSKIKELVDFSLDVINTVFSVILQYWF